MSSDKIEIIETSFKDEGEISVTQIDHLAMTQKIKAEGEILITQIDQLPKGQKTKDKSEKSESENQLKNVNSAEPGDIRVEAPLASEEALESEMDVLSSDASSDKQLLSSMESRNDSEGNKRLGLVTLSKSKIFPEGDGGDKNNGNHQNGRVGDNIQVETADIVRRDSRDADDPNHGYVYNFFRREKKAFWEESKKKLRQIPKKNTRIDFEEIAREFKGEGKDSPANHWTNKAKKREGEKCPELSSPSPKSQSPKSQSQDQRDLG